MAWAFRRGGFVVGGVRHGVVSFFWLPAATIAA
jgi:hypothetical protein